MQKNELRYLRNQIRYKREELNIDEERGDNLAYSINGLIAGASGSRDGYFMAEDPDRNEIEDEGIENMLSSGRNRVNNVQSKKNDEEVDENEPVTLAIQHQLNYISAIYAAEEKVHSHGAKYFFRHPFKWIHERITLSDLRERAAAKLGKTKKGLDRLMDDIAEIDGKERYHKTKSNLDMRIYQEKPKAEEVEDREKINPEKLENDVSLEKKDAEIRVPFNNEISNPEIQPPTVN